jgi:hypothetical protein
MDAIIDKIRRAKEKNECAYMLWLDVLIYYDLSLFKSVCFFDGCSN